MTYLVANKFARKLAGIFLSLALILMCVPYDAPRAYAADNVPTPTDAVVITEDTTDGFTHPGVGLTKAILENMREQILAGNDPWYSHYQAMTLSSNASRTVTSSNASSSDPTKPATTAMNSKGAFVADGLKAYTQAVMYYITGDEIYRANAMRIIRIWSQMNPDQYTYFTDSHIHMGIPLHRMVTAAEILRYSSTPDGSEALEWTDKDTQDFTTNLINPTIETFLHDNNYFMNQHTYPLLGAISGYIFTNNRERYNEGVEWFTVNESAIDQGKNGSIKRLFRLVDHDALTGEPLDPPRVQHVEMGRDQAHGAGDLTNAEILGRLLEAQGTKVDPVTGTVSTAPTAVSAFGFLNNRILDAADYFARFMLGYDTPWTPTAAYMDPEGNPTIIYKELSEAYRGRIGGNVYGLYYYYKYEAGLDLDTAAPYYAEMFHKKTPFYWESPDGGADYWMFIPKEAAIEGTDSLPKVSANADWIEIEYRTTLLDSNSTIVQEEDTAYVRLTATETGSRIALVASSTSATTIGFKVRTNGTARLEINGWADEPLVLPDTGGQWKYVTYKLGHLRGLGDLIYFEAIGDGTMIDIDHIHLGAAEQLTPPAFTMGSVPLHLFTYLGSSTQVQYDFSAQDANEADVVSYQISGKPESGHFDNETGAFSWKPGAAGNYSFVVSATDGTSIAAREVHITVSPDRQAAMAAVVAPYNEGSSYVSSSLAHYRAVYDEVAGLVSNASDELFLEKLIELRLAVESLQQLTPLLTDGSMDYSKMLTAATFYNEIPNLLDDYAGSFAFYGNAVNLIHTMDFGPDFKVAANAFSLQVRASFPERIGGTTIFGSNDKETWVRLTPGLTEVSEDMQTLEVSEEHRDKAFRFFKIQMIDPRNETTPNAMLELSEFRIFGERQETNNKLQSVTLSSPQSSQNRIDTGDTVLLTFQSTEPIQDVRAVIQGQQAEMYTMDGIHWIASTTMGSQTPTGKINFEITYKTADGRIADPVIFPSNNSLLYYVNQSSLLNVPKLATVVASSNQWGNNGLPKEQVGYLLFDGKTTTFGDLADGTGAYYIVDFGADATIQLTDSLMMPRTGHSGRLNGTVVQGSVNGADWTDLTTAVSGAADNTWMYLGASSGNNGFYRYIRLYNSGAWSGNIAEVELYGEYDVQSIDSKVLGPEGYTRLSYYTYMQEVERIRTALGQPDTDELALLEQLWQAEKLLQSVSTLPDKSLLQHWAAKAETITTNLYTEETVQAFNEALDAANAMIDNADVGQEAVDQAADVLMTALESLAYLLDVPVLEPLTAVSGNVESAISFTIGTRNSVEGTTYTASSLPEGASFNSATGVFDWTPSREQGGIYSLVFTASADGRSTSQTLSIKVKGYPQLAESFIPSEWTARNTLSSQITATDPSGEKLTYTINGLPPGRSLNALTGVFVWTPGQADYGNYTVEVSASNGTFTTTREYELRIELDRKEALPYTKASYYVYSNEWTRIRTVMEQAGANKVQLAAELDQAEAKLTSTGTLPAERIAVTQEQATASTVHYDDRASAATPELLNKNGWQALDGQLSTFTDTTASNGWILVDFGEGNSVSVGSFRFYPRSTHVTRLNGAILQGSNDGVEFLDLYTITGVSAAQWHKAPIHDQGSYRYLRYYSPNGNTNVAELEFYEKALDTTLLKLFVDEAEVINQAAYTEASVAVMLEAKTAAESLIQNGEGTQVQIDAAADELQQAMRQLVVKEGSSNGGYIPPVTIKEELSVTDTGLQIKPSVKDGKVQTTISSAALNEAIAHAAQTAGKTLIVELSSEEDYSSFSLQFPADGWLKAIQEGITAFAVDSQLVSVRIPAHALPELISGDQVMLSIGTRDIQALPSSISSRLENKPVLEFSLTVNGQAISDFQNWPIKVRIPYSRQAGEQAESLVAVYMNDNGEMEIIRSSTYDGQSGMVVFDALHFSTYAVLSNPVSFLDMDSHSWARSSVVSLAARQIVNGIGDNQFAPERTVTRAEFLKMMMEAFGLVKQGLDSSFTDAEKGQWYYDSIATAQSLTIINGYGDGSFGVNRGISREEMAVISVRILKAAGFELPRVRDGAAFLDAAQIADYAAAAVKAMNEAGYVEGKGNGRFAPKAQTTRAEAAVLIARMLGLN